MPLLLTERDVRAVLSMPDLIDAMARALAAYSSGGAVQPVRTTIEVNADPSFFAVMPASLATPAAVGAKLVTVYPGNHAKHLPSHLASIVLLDPATGGLVALLDGRYITEARTAAVSAVSVKHLARPEATVLAIIGSGVQARSHLDAIRCVRAITDVRVWSPTAAHADAFVHAARAASINEARAATPLPIRTTADAATAVRGADLVVLATSSRVPVIGSEDVADGAHVCAVGACRPDQREMPTALVARARVFVDARVGALAEAGDLLLPIREGAFGENHIAGELGEVVLGRVAGRTSASAVTIFKSLGMAAEDVVAAALVTERAKAAGLGRSFDLT
jgi:ornithine cyclodeaminase